MSMSNRYIARDLPIWIRLILKRVSHADIDIADAKSVPDDVLDELFAIFATLYEGANREKFARDFREKTWAVILRDRRDGRLVGFSTFMDFIMPIEVDGQTQDVGIMYVGDVVKERAYWGERGLQIAMLFLGLEAGQKHAPRPFVWWYMTKGFRTFMNIAPSFRVTYPNPFAETPPFYQAILNAVGESRYPKSWNPKTGVVEMADYRVSPEIQEHPAHLAGNPWLEFYLARNPGHTVGHELAGVALVTPPEVIVAATRQMARQITSPLRKTRVGRMADRALTDALDKLRKYGARS